MQVEDFFTHLLQRVVPKHDTQARAEVTVTRRFLENFSADQARPQHLSAHALTCRQPRADAVAAGLPRAMLDRMDLLVSTPCASDLAAQRRASSALRVQSGLMARDDPVCLPPYGSHHSQRGSLQRDC